VPDAEADLARAEALASDERFAFEPSHLGCTRGVACNGGPERDCPCRCHWYDDPVYDLRGRM
jgi:hypothetical protein